MVNFIINQALFVIFAHWKSTFKFKRIKIEAIEFLLWYCTHIVLQERLALSSISGHSQQQYSCRFFNIFTYLLLHNCIRISPRKVLFLQANKCHGWNLHVISTWYHLPSKLTSEGLSKINWNITVGQKINHFWDGQNSGCFNTVHTCSPGKWTSPLNWPVSCKRSDLMVCISFWNWLLRYSCRPCNSFMLSRRIASSSFSAIVIPLPTIALASFWSFFGFHFSSNSSSWS